MPSFTVLPPEKGLRLDRFLLNHLPGWSRNQIELAVRQGRVEVNGRVPGGTWYVKPGQEIAVQETSQMHTPEPPGLPAVYEDAWLLVINKPAGMVVHESPGHEGRSLEERLAASLPKGAFVPRAVHRIDKETTGLVLLAKSDAARARLSRAMRERRVHKVYRAIVWGAPTADEGVIDLPIGWKVRRGGRKVEVVDEAGPEAWEALTRYKVLQRGHGWSELELALETGRTHQIRLHLRAIGCAVINDPVYGKEEHLRRLASWPALRNLLDRQTAFALHAERLTFNHPMTRRPLEVTVEPPASFTALRALLVAGPAPRARK